MTRTVNHELFCICLENCWEFRTEQILGMLNSENSQLSTVMSKAKVSWKAKFPFNHRTTKKKVHTIAMTINQIANGLLPKLPEQQTTGMTRKC